LEFPSFGEEFTDWVIKRFSSAHIKCDRKAIQNLRKMVQDTPNYVQMVCFYLVAQGVRHITSVEVERALNTVVRQNAYECAGLLQAIPYLRFQRFSEIRQ